ncbi:recombinase family protein [Lentzea tibetensis]|uniref:Recombinase family protein n=1 Tax=Lentzea tibetensis TaxID=2591470 RepID=A0A563EHH4_9PSEU|nr:recombinase family protein [Lentzea tibetensis]TWP45944.1 recombinase family protein [Lentzea tibetensis]
MAAAKGTTVISSLRLAYGYVRVGDGSPERVEVQRAALRDLAGEYGLLLDTVFIDYQVRTEVERPAFLTLLDVVRELHPYSVLVPSAWHVSQWPLKRVELLDRFKVLGCSVLAANRGRPSVLVTGHQEPATPEP